MKIDAHQHFWKYNLLRDSWITPDVSAIRQDFLPVDLWKELSAAGIDGSVAVQTSQTEEENEFLLSLASQNSFIKGIVGWVDLRATNIVERLACYAGDKKMKGFRHVLQGEENRAFMLTRAFTNGISQLEAFSFNHPDFHKCETTLMGSRNTTRDDFEHVIDSIKSGLVQPHKYITHHVTFGDVKDRFASWLNPGTDVIKAMIGFD